MGRDKKLQEKREMWYARNKPCIFHNPMPKPCSGLMGSHIKWVPSRWEASKEEMTPTNRPRSHKASCIWVRETKAVCNSYLTRNKGGLTRFRKKKRSQRG